MGRSQLTAFHVAWKRRLAKWGIAGVLLLAGWIAVDFAFPGSYQLRRFDAHEVGRLETAMWRSYYGHDSLRLFGQLIELLRVQYHVPFWPSVAGAYHAARAAVVFQRGHDRAGYELALPDLLGFYAIVRRGSDSPFSVEKAARLELEWWIVHRELSVGLRRRPQPYFSGK